MTIKNQKIIQSSINNDKVFKSIRNIDYSNLIIYKISCKNENIKDIYVGQTINYEQRKYAHRRSSKISDTKLYKTIRENGGWDNWIMEQINTFNCKDTYEARQIEQKYCDILKATLNTVRAYSKEYKNEELDRKLEQILNEEIYDYEPVFGWLLDYYYENEDMEKMEKMEKMEEIEEIEEIEEMEEFKCKYCKHSFRTATVLKNHQTRTKYCIEIQQKLNINIIKDLKTCNYCFNDFASHLLNRHLLTCKILKENTLNNILEKNKYLETQITEKDRIIAEKDLKIAKIEGELNFMKQEHEKEHKCLMEIAKQPKTTNNTTINNKILNMNPLDLKTERIKNIIDTDFDHNYGCSGQKGIAEFAKDKLLKDDKGNPTYVCTDFDRKVFKYKDEFGEVHKDTKAKKLTNKLVEAGIVKKNQEKAEKWWTDESGDIIKDRQHFMCTKVADINNIENDNSIFVRELSTITVT